MVRGRDWAPSGHGTLGERHNQKKLEWALKYRACSKSPSYLDLREVLLRGVSMS
jgi:hypothetical protein